MLISSSLDGIDTFLTSFVVLHLVTLSGFGTWDLGNCSFFDSLYKFNLKLIRLSGEKRD